MIGRSIVYILLLMSACDRKPAAIEAKPTPVTAAPAKATSPEPTPPLPTEAMIEQLLAQHVLDHPRVLGYLHTEVAGNLPLTVAPSADLAQGAAKLQAGGQAVRVVPVGEARVVFKGRERIGPARERVRFEVPAEGVAGHVDLELADNVWSAVDAVVVER